MEPVELNPAEMAAMHKACFPVRPWAPEEFLSLMQQNGVFWGVDHERRGFIMARAAGGEAEIITLAVDPAHRRKGVARDLVENVLRTCPMLEAERLILEVAADNKAALGLYRAMGFSEAARRPNYYVTAEGARVDALVMQAACPAVTH